MTTKIGVDLGYANITLSSVTADVRREASVVTVDKSSRKILSVGDKAAIIGMDTDGEGMPVRPFKNGLLYSSEITKEVINYLVNSVKPAEKIRCVVGIPSDFLAKQTDELINMFLECGVEQCFAVSRAAAALIGAGYSPNINAISVNIGAKSTEIAVFYKGKIILSWREDVGGEDFDKVIKDHILEQGDMNVSLYVARTIKERLGAVWQGRESENIDIEGTLALTGSKVRMGISTEDVVGVFEAPLKKLILAVANLVKMIPLDAVEEIFENGIVLSGGGAELYGLDKMMTKVLGISVTKAADPIDCVAKGLSRINALLPIKLHSSGNDITSKLSKYYEAKTQTKK